MIAMRKQLQKWRDEWLQYWGRTSLVMRIITGAVASLLIASVWLKYWNKPLLAELKKVQKKFEEVSAFDKSFSMRMSGLKLERAAAEKEMNLWKGKMEELERRGLRFEPADCGIVLLRIHHKLEKYELALKEEKAEEQPSPRASAKNTKNKTAQPAVTWKTTKTYPPFFAPVRYHYQIEGEFESMSSFLKALPSIEKAFELNNICIENVRSSVPDGGLLLEFDLTALILSESVPPEKIPDKAEKKKEEPVAKTNSDTKKAAKGKRSR